MFEAETGLVGLIGADEGFEGVAKGDVGEMLLLS